MNCSTNNASKSRRWQGFISPSKEVQLLLLAPVNVAENTRPDRDEVVIFSGMAVKTHDTNPAISSTQIREILKLENEIDGYLMNHLSNGKALCAIKASSQEVVDEVVKRYKRSGWVIIATPAMEGVWQLRFEDPDQLEVTKRLRPVKA